MRVKTEKHMKAILFLNFILLTFFSCNSENGVKKEIQNNILMHKKFIRESSFKGKIYDKVQCNQCNFNKYQIKIKIDEMRPNKIELGNLSFQPYYSVILKKEITLSVNKELYEATEKGLEVEKKANSNTLVVMNKDYRLLNEKKYTWMP